VPTDNRAADAAAQPLVEPPLSATAVTAGEPAAGGPPLLLRGREAVLRLGMIWVLIGLALAAYGVYPGFFDPENLNNMFAQVAPVGIIAIGMTYVIIAGGFDLSVAAIYAGGSVVYVSLANHTSLWLAFAATIAIATLAGVLNGLVLTVLKINTFIATLATASLFGGAAYLYTNSNPVLTTKPGFGALGTGKWGGIWISIYVLAALALLAGVILARTTYGRSVYAVGGNREAARLAGIRTNWIQLSTFMITGACAAVGGMIIASQTGVGQANIGSDVALNSIAVVVVGGTSLLGGEGAIWRTVIGIMIWATINDLFSSLALSTSAQLLIEGSILLFAVSLDSLARRTRR
jgi:ribose transport system permease protein